VTTSLGHRPAGKWSFDESVAECFDDMLKRSIPAIEPMRAIVANLGVRFLRPSTNVLDLGASRGDALVALLKRAGTCMSRADIDSVSWIALEQSPAMLEILRRRFSGNPRIAVLDMDLRSWAGDANVSVALAILTLVFVPTEFRSVIVEHVYASLLPGGAFLMVEKVQAETGRTQRLLVETYHEFKASNGYSATEIEAKRASMEGVQVPLTAAGNESLLRAAGFRHVECIWRWGNFAGWLAIKD